MSIPRKKMINATVGKRYELTRLNENLVADQSESSLNLGRIRGEGV